MRSIFLFATRLYLALTVLAVVPASGRAVLCVATDGHVAIEAGAGRCVDSSPTESGATANMGASLAPDHCGDCVDVPVGRHILSAAHSRGFALNLQNSPATTAVGDLAADWFAASIRSTPTPGIPTHSSFPPSRTTILRN